MKIKIQSIVRVKHENQSFYFTVVSGKDDEFGQIINNASLRLNLFDMDKIELDEILAKHVTQTTHSIPSFALPHQKKRADAIALQLLTTSIEYHTISFKIEPLKSCAEAINNINTQIIMEE